MNEEGLPIFITLIVSAVIIFVGIIAGLIIATVLSVAMG